MRKLCVIGTGYVGLVNGACFADMGNRVVCVDTDESKIALLNEGVVPIYEPGLESLIHKNMSAGRLSVTTSCEEDIGDSDFVLVCVGTPPAPDNRVDLGYMRQAYMDVASTLDETFPIMVNKSTVPPGTAEAMRELMTQLLNESRCPAIVSNPEFLREGHAVHDFMNPSRVIVGADDPWAAEAVADLYEPLNVPILKTSVRTAEMVKLVSSSFLAAKISFINEIASICEETGIDVEEVVQGVGLDPRIGKDFLRAGPGYGGSCLPKDIGMLNQFAVDEGRDVALLDSVIDVNKKQPLRLVDKLAELLGTLQGSRVALLGLSFKAGTDDIRFSPALSLLQEMQARGATVKAYDPKAKQNAMRIMPEIEYAGDPYECVEGCDALVIATEWEEFKDLDLKRIKASMNGSVVLDTRNVIDPAEAEKSGLVYRGVGKGTLTKPTSEISR